MGTLEAPQDRHGQDHRTGTSRAEQITEAGSSGGHGGAGSSEGHGRCKELRRPWQVVFHGRGLVPRPGNSSRNPSTPKKISLGKLWGIRSPPGLDKKDST